MSHAHKTQSTELKSVRERHPPLTNVKAVPSSHLDGLDPGHLGLREVVCGQLVGVLQPDDGCDRTLVVLVGGKLVLVEGDGGHQL